MKFVQVVSDMVCLNTYILSYNIAEVLTIDKRTTVSEVKKMLEPCMKLASNQFKVVIS